LLQELRWTEQWVNWRRDEVRKILEGNNRQVYLAEGCNIKEDKRWVTILSQDSNELRDRYKKWNCTKLK